MAITVRELLALPHLRMTLIAGAGGLDREITWVHTSDLPDPWKWLGSGELLLTNGTGLSPDESAQVAFVERLAGIGASGLGIGLGMSGPPLAGRVSRRADELRLPLVAVPYSMPFTAVVRAVADANDRQERRRRLGADLLSQLIDRRIDERVAEPQIADLGLDLAVSVLVAARAGPGSTAADLRRRLDRSRVPHLLLHRDRVLYIALPEEAARPHLLQQPGEPEEPDRRAGISDRIAAAGRLPDAAAEARWALGAAEAEKRPLVRYGDETALLLPRSATEARAVVARILGPLIRADAEHGTDYVNTLRVVLDRDRSWLAASADLHIHKQTLGYRIRKIEQLTGRGLARTEHLAEWWFALRAHDLLAGRHLNLAAVSAQ